MGALPTVGVPSEMSMKQTELITGMGGQQGICREPGVRTVPGAGKRGCGLDWCAWPAMPPSPGATRHLTIKHSYRDKILGENDL
jgi:hypothetical protein